MPFRPAREHWSVKDGFDAGGANGEPAVHGTAVAGIIAAHAELTGVAPQARILAVRAFGATDAKAAARGTTYDILAGIEWSELHGARIVNMSFAGPPDPDLSTELADGARRGVIFIAAVAARRSRPRGRTFTGEGSDHRGGFSGYPAEQTG
jgi:subtilisin family serine protease